MKKSKNTKVKQQKSKKKKATTKSAGKVLPFAQTAKKKFGGVSADKKLVLHIGLGTTHRTVLNARYKGEKWQELRVDPDASLKPDVVTDLISLSSIPNAVADAVWLPHLLCRLTAAQIQPFLKQVRRVLKPNGELLLTTPDMTALARAILETGLEVPLNPKKGNSPAPIDLIYGPRADVLAGKPLFFQSGFVANTLVNNLVMAGFSRIRVASVNAALTAHALYIEQPSEADRKIEIKPEDLNEKMRIRDEMDKPPLRWDNPTL